MQTFCRVIRADSHPAHRPDVRFVRCHWTDVHVQDVVAEPVKNADGPRKLRFPQLEDVIDNFPLTSVSGTNGSIMNIFLIRSDVRASFDAFPKRILIFQLTGSPLSLCFS